MRQEPLVVCMYGWGKEFRLYHDCLEVNGMLYALADLERVYPVYHRVFGVPSARLELRFGKHTVILRGIADIEDLQKVVAYLNCLSPQTSTIRFRPGANWCASQWHKQLLTTSTNTTQASTPVTVADRNRWLHWGREEESTTPAMIVPGIHLRQTGAKYDINRKAYAQALTAPMPAPHWDRLRQEHRVRRQRRAHIERSIREHGFDVERLTRRLQEADLPRVPVPVHLAPGEFAHYSTAATLREEPYLTESLTAFPAKDHGTIILTNKRFLYIGRSCQMVLDYGRLAQHMRLRGAIALRAGHWSQQEIFEVQRPLECSLYLDCILQRFRQMQMRDEVRLTRTIALHHIPHTQKRHLQTPSIMDLDTIPLTITPLSMRATFSRSR